MADTAPGEAASYSTVNPRRARMDQSVRDLANERPSERRLRHWPQGLTRVP